MTTQGTAWHAHFSEYGDLYVGQITVLKHTAKTVFTSTRDWHTNFCERLMPEYVQPTREAALDAVRWKIDNWFARVNKTTQNINAVLDGTKDHTK